MTLTLPRLVADDGTAVELEIERWVGEADATDTSVLERVTGPALDIGCGPGRIALALAQRGIPCLGVDVSPTALYLALGKGALVLERSIFQRIPGHGRWRTTLLFDGNVGIGGDPIYLLQRAASLLHPRGRILVELEPDATTRILTVRLQTEDGCGASFPWAIVGTEGFPRIADMAGCIVKEMWLEGGRAFASLARHQAP